MASLWVWVIRGANKPLPELLTSSMALTCGGSPSSLTPTLCACEIEETRKTRINNRMHSFFITENLDVKKCVPVNFYLLFSQIALPVLVLYVVCPVVPVHSKRPVGNDHPIEPLNLL